jgi:hypothetical protein
MALHKLILDDIEDVSYSLLAIHCTMEDFRVAYLLNKHLKISLKRREEDLDFAFKKASFSLFEWKDVEKMITWNLISNVSKVEEEGILNTESLFNVPNKIIRTHNLIPEYKKVNYFLKIYNDGNFINEKSVIANIQQIPHIVTVYSLDASQLKSKDNLIFI